MSSSGWEVVTKNKRDKNSIKNGKLSKAEKKKFIDNAPKVEDFLPLNQVKTLYDNLDDNNENKTSKNKENKTKENEEKKERQKQNQQQSEKKKQQQQKPKEKTKSIDKSVITVDQINEVLEADRVLFPDAPLIWLKDLVAYVNTNVIVEKTDPIFSNKPDAYPLSLITKAVRITFEKVIKSAGPQTVRLFYEGTLLLMTKNMSNGMPDIGCKIFLQLLAQMYPDITCANIEKHISLRNSYQNKKPIGLSFLWAISQGGKKNLTVGLKLWHEVMAPMLESRNYAHYVLKILKDLVDIHKNVNSLTTEMYLNIVDDLCSGKINIPVSLAKEVNACLDTLRLSAIQSDKINVQSLFEAIFDNISPKTIAPYKEELMRILSACVVHDDVHCLSSWRNLHAKRLYQSDLLIQQLADDFNSIRSNVNTKVLKETLSIFQATETKMKKNKESQLMAACHIKAQDLIKKMAATPKKSRSFPYKKGSILLLLLIGAIVALDCKKHGSFEASSTGRLLKTSGTITYGQKVWLMTQHYTNSGLAYLEASSPEYYKYAENLGKHYGKLAGDFYLIGRNLSFKLYNNAATYIEEKRPIVVDTIESNFPGWLDTIQSTADKQLELTRKYSAQTADYVISQSKIFNRWLETRVFVGNLSPENIGKYATKTLETTQTFASQMYDWVYEKVQTLSKVE